MALLVILQQLLDISSIIITSCCYDDRVAWSFQSSPHDVDVCADCWSHYAPFRVPSLPPSAYSFLQCPLYALSYQSPPPTHRFVSVYREIAQSRSQLLQSHFRLYHTAVAPPSAIVQRDIRVAPVSVASSGRNAGLEQPGRSRPGGEDLVKMRGTLRARRNRQQLKQLLAGDGAIGRFHRLID